MNKKQLKAKKLYYESFKDSVDYIQIYDNAISDTHCEHLIGLHEELKKAGLGKKGQVSADFTKIMKDGDIANTYKDSVKSSYDIYLNTMPGYFMKKEKKKDLDSISNLYKSLNEHICDYLIKVGIMGIDFIGTGLRAFSNHGIKKGKSINNMFSLREVCLRKYDKMTGGYHKMHCDVQHGTLLRCAAGVLYLNTIKSGGETKFPVLGREVKPKKGRLVIFPPYYTHMHYGEIAKTNDRYVIVCHVIFNGVKLEFNNKENDEWEEQ